MDYTSTWGTCKHSCACESSVLCAFTNKLLLLKTKEEERGLDHLCLHFMQALCVGVFEGSALFVGVYVTGHVSVLYVSWLSVCLCFWDMYSVCYWWSLQTGEWQLDPLPWGKTLCFQGTLDWGPATRKEGVLSQSSWRQHLH